MRIRLAVAVSIAGLIAAIPARAGTETLQSRFRGEFCMSTIGSSTSVQDLATSLMKTFDTNSDGKLRRVYTAVFALRNDLGAL